MEPDHLESEVSTRSPLLKIGCLIVAGTTMCLIGLIVWIADDPAAAPPTPEKPAGPPPLSRYIRLPSDFEDNIVRENMLTADDMQGFLGAQTCAECHAEKYDSFQHTGHARTSAWPSADTLMGSFSGESRILRTRNEKLWYEMERDGDRWFQKAIARDERGQEDHRQSIDLIFGSGKIAQTFLYFQGDRVLELPLSYLRGIDAWANSPGYRGRTADFARQVGVGCLECHTTCVSPNPAYPADGEQPYNMILGISCERCHGPGREHVDWHRANPEDKVARHVVHPGKLSQTRQLEICAQCHGGEPEEYHSPGFTYRPGTPLHKHVLFKQFDANSRVGVHTTNQADRLAMSACFQESEEMTCTTCHNPHVFERGDLVTFSNRCLSCHETEHCGISKTLGDRIRKNCIDCHVPIKLDYGTPFQMPDEEVYLPPMRDHLIKVYPKLSRELLPRFQDDPDAKSGE